ncbi:MAG: glycosyltransferase family 4 protein [Bryobacteraceae bacterium]|jgi:glycosyltransferase involved in cell wall biosynthesis
MAQRLARRYKVSLIVDGSPRIADLMDFFGVNLAGVDLTSLHLPIQSRLRRLASSQRGALLRRAHVDMFLLDLRIALERTYFRQIHSLGFDLIVNNNGFSTMPCPAPHGIYMCMFPHELKGELRPDENRSFLRELYVNVGNRVVGMSHATLNSYDVITANSQFTSEWIRRLWRRDSTVVYSACEDMGPAAAKSRMILHVGRFVAEWRNDYKHQRTLLEAFRRCGRLIQDGWELHFAGSMLSDRDGTAATARLEREVAGLPVVIHRNASFESLRDLYRRSSIYWHATGYGSSPELHPGKQEHFGITTVEAMSAGVVPVVINSGGQRETVQHGVNGFLWNSLEELQDYTCRLAEDPALLKRLSDRAIASSSQFSRTAFADRMESLVDSLLNT